MNRLTCKPDGAFEIYYYETTEENRLNDSIAITQKLGKLEDIEQKLGVSLEVFFKAIFQDCVYVKLPNGSIDESDFSPQLSYDRDCLYFTTLYDDDFICYNLVDYGKTWSLIKEDLL